MSTISKLLQPTKQGLCQPEDEDNWKRLVGDVQGGNCALFVGSGPSVPTYGTWRKLVAAVAAAAGVECPKDLPPSTFPDFLDECRGPEGSKTDLAYRSTLKDFFDPIGKELYRPVHSAMLRANFRTYVTTNLDSMIENAGQHQDVSIRPENIQRYPTELSPVLLGRRTVTHLHGQAYDWSSGECLLPDVVLSRRDFEQAYDSPDVPDILLHLLRYYNVLFVGFSAEDGVLQRVLRTDLRTFLKRMGLRSPCQQHQGGGQRRFYVLRDTPLISREGTIGTPEDEVRKTRAEIKSWFDIPSYVVGEVIPILYVVGDGDSVHTALDRLLTELQERARYAAHAAPPKPASIRAPYLAGKEI